MCKNTPIQDRRKESDQPSRVIHPIPCRLFSPETVVQNEQAARKEEHGTSQADRKTNPERQNHGNGTRTRHQRHEPDTLTLHNQSSRLGKDPKVVWYQGGRGIGIAGIEDDIAGTEGLVCA